MKTGSEFIEKFGMVAEQDGFPRIAGRMMGFLLLNEGPYTLDELAEELQISKTSASTNARLLEGHGVIERVIKNDETVCTKPNAIGFRKLRELVMATFSSLNKAMDRIGPAENLQPGPEHSCNQ